MTPRRSQRLRLLDIAAEIDAIDHAVRLLDARRFRDNWLIRSAVERALEIISEATRHLDEALKASEPEIPWRRVADIGNWLRHAYDRVDPALIWFVVIDELPALAEATARLLLRVPED